MEFDFLQQQQEEILDELKSIRFMKKGSITYQRVSARQDGTEAPVTYGPYPLLTWKEAGRTKSMRLNSAEKVAWAEVAIANRQRFVNLCREYEKLAEHSALELASSLDMDTVSD